MSAWTGQGSSPGLPSHQLRLLGLMAEAAHLSPEAFLDGVVRALPGVSGYADLDEARFNTIADSFVAIGFRHPALPILSAAQRACLDRCRRRMGLSGREALDLFKHSTGVASPRRMTGSNFIGLMVVFEQVGAAEDLPSPGFMDRHKAAMLRRRAWRAGVCQLGLLDLMMKFGGTTSLRGLDERACTRIMARLGGPNPEPAPRVEGAPGMVTQAQANLIWKVWHEARPGLDASIGSFDVAIRLMLRFPGGFDTLTRAGANEVLDRLTASLERPLDLSAGRAIGLSREAAGELLS